MRILVIIGLAGLVLIGCKRVRPNPSAVVIEKNQPGITINEEIKVREEPKVEPTVHAPETGQENFVKLKKNGGVYEMVAEINGIPKIFIYDTGASNIVISLKELRQLIENETISEDDIIGEIQSIVADGSVVNGLEINLKSVKIGNKTLNNVEAIVLESADTPLLLGQTALSRFGKVTVDNNRGGIIFQ